MRVIEMQQRHIRTHTNNSHPSQRVGNAQGTAIRAAAGANTTASNIDLLSVSNIKSTGPEANRLWAHLLSAYVISLFAMAVSRGLSR
jgi:hypothetical protein